MYTTTRLSAFIHLFCSLTPVNLVNQDDEIIYTGLIKDIPWKFMNYYLSYAPCSKITDDNYAIDIIDKELIFYLREES
jgi:hypothetical protein